MNTIEAVIEAVNTKAQANKQDALLTYSESVEQQPGSVDFTCTITVVAGKTYEVKKSFLPPAEVFIELTREKLLAAVLYDLLTS